MRVPLRLEFLVTDSTQFTTFFTVLFQLNIFFYNQFFNKSTKLVHICSKCNASKSSFIKKHFNKSWTTVHISYKKSPQKIFNAIPPQRTDLENEKLKFYRKDVYKPFNQELLVTKSRFQFECTVRYFNLKCICIFRLRLQYK